MVTPTDRSSRRSAPLARIALGVAASVLLVLIAIPGWILLGSEDRADPGDEALLAESVDLRGGRPAHGTFARLGALAADLDHGRIGQALEALHEGDLSEAAWVHRQARERAALLETLLDAPPVHSQSIPSAGGFSEEHDDEGGMAFVSLARLSAARALALSHETRHDEAVEAAMYGLRAGQALASSRDIDLLGMMLVGASQRASLAALEHLARRGSISVGMARSVTDEIAARQPTRDDWRRTWANEYRWVRGVVLEAFDPDAEHEPSETGIALDDSWALRLLRRMPRDYLIQPNRTLARFASVYQERRRRAGAPCLAIQLRLAQAAPPPGQWGLLLRPNPIGEILFHITAPNADRFELTRCGFERDFALARIVIAAKAFSDEQGRLPASADVLVPRYLDRMPRDPYDGGEIRYSAAERRVEVDPSPLFELLPPDRADALRGQSVARDLDFRSVQRAHEGAADHAQL